MIELFEALRLLKLLLYVLIPDGECSIMTLWLEEATGFIGTLLSFVENTACCWFLKTPPAFVLYMEADYTRLSNLALSIVN